MFARIVVPMLGVAVLAACTPRAQVAEGTAIVDETVALQRQADADVATREIEVDGDAILVAVVDENLTDVRVKLSAPGIAAVEVENDFAGSGIEIATLELREDSRVTLTLTGPPDTTRPGAVHVTLRRFTRAAARDPAHAALITGYLAWSAGTNASHRPEDFRKSGLADLDRAIASLSDESNGDPRLAAEAQLIKANILTLFLIDVKQAYETAHAVAARFGQLGEAAKLQAARAQLVEANALSEIAVNPRAQDPDAEEAARMAVALLDKLSADTSALGAVERARALDCRASLYTVAAQLDDAERTYEKARAAFAAAGHVSGETEMKAQLAQTLAERGQWDPASAAYRAVIADMGRISNPLRRAKMLLDAGYAIGHTADTDLGMKLMTDAISVARANKLPSVEGEASWTLAWLYWFRGDALQAKQLFNHALNIARTLDNELGLAANLQTAGMVARGEGDYETAIRLHQEAIPASPTPFQRIRATRDLALDYAAVGRHTEAIQEFRNALAVRIQDPKHHIFTDIKRDLAEALIEHGDGSAESLAEAVRLLAESMQMSVKMNDARNQIGGHRVLARLAVKQHKLAQARAEYQRCFEMIFRYRTASANPQLRMDALEQEQAAFRGYFDLMMGDAANGKAGEPRMASADARAALRMLERSRESRFGMPRAVVLDAGTRARIDTLLEQMADRSLKISRLLQQKSDAQQAAELEALQLELARLRVEVDRERTVAAEKQSAAELPATVALRAWRPVTPGAAQLSYALGGEHAYVWIRDAGGLRVAVLDQPPARIELDLATLAGLDAQRGPEKIEQSLAAMSAVLLPPGVVPADTHALEIVAEGRIANVPFAGLKSPVDPARRLVETHALTVITSMYAAEPPDAAPARPFQLVALASGSGTLRSAAAPDPLPRLQSATAEIQAIADLFRSARDDAKVKLFAGSDGDADTLHTLWSSGADVVHFATHALADLRQPLASLLVLPARDAAGAPSYLTAGQVQEWRGDVGLVFLSACESAIGPPRFASGMPGLQSAFLRAGAHGVIATLWPIEDGMAREFTADFYRRFTGGASAAQSLSETQRAWLAPRAGVDQATQLRRRITALAHGYYTM